MVVRFAKMAVLVAALAFTSQAAQAGHARKKVDPAIVATEIGVGAASTAGYFALGGWHWRDFDTRTAGITRLGAGVATTIGCAALSPIVATAIAQRPLSYREAHILVGSCIIPIVGGWLVNEAYNRHILWAPDEVPPAKPVKRRMAKK